MSGYLVNKAWEDFVAIEFVGTCWNVDSLGFSTEGMTADEIMKEVERLVEQNKKG